MGPVENKGHSIPVCHLGPSSTPSLTFVGTSVFTPSSVWLFLLRFFASSLLALFCIFGAFRYVPCCSPAEESATTAVRLYGALASAYLLSEVPLLVSLRLRFYFWLYEGDGTCPPRPQVSILGHHTLRGPQCCLRYSIDSKDFASLVDSSGGLRYCLARPLKRMSLSGF